MTVGPAYGRAHRALRARWRARVASGTVRCARGDRCKRAEIVGGTLVGGLIDPSEPWDLGHDDRDPSVYRGPEHSSCNRATKGRAGTRRRAPEVHPGLIG